MEVLQQGEGIRWHPVSVVEKYSADQVAWARRKMAVQSDWGWRARRTVLHGSWLRGLFREPEGGVVYDEGNGVVRGGRLNLAYVLTGTGGHQLAPGRSVFGVGTDASEFDPEHVHLSRADGEDPDRSFYRPMDHGFPLVTAGAVIKAQATFTETDACFAWHEWCTAVGPGAPLPHHSLREVYSGGPAVMMNRKASPAGYGAKEFGVAWCFRTEITLG